MAGRGERATLAKDDNGSGASSSFLEGEEIREGGGRLGRSSTFEREDYMAKYHSERGALSAGALGSSGI